MKPLGLLNMTADYLGATPWVVKTATSCGLQAFVYAEFLERPETLRVVTFLPNPRTGQFLMRFFSFYASLNAAEQ